MIDWDSLVIKPNHSTFGEAVTYQSPTFGIFTLTDAILDRGYISVGTDAGGVPVTALGTTLSVRLASCPVGFAPADGDLITARGSTWQVVDEQPDGKGSTVLILSVAP